MKLRPSDIAFSKWIRLRDMKCMRCSSPVKLNADGMPVSHQASHFKGRRKEATRFEPLNVDTLCGGCHMYLGGQPDEHVAWQVERKGQEVVDQIILQANGYKKRNDKEEVKKWREAIKEITHGRY
jgi:hypothetical protein